MPNMTLLSASTPALSNVKPRGRAECVSRELTWSASSFPYCAKDPVHFERFMRDYFYFTIEGYKHPLGLVHRKVIDSVPWPEYWSIDHQSRRLHLKAPAGAEEGTKTELFLNETIRLAKLYTQQEELIVEGHAEEVYTATGEHVCNMDPAGWQIFGTTAFGVHLIAWSICPFLGKLYWLQRRSWTKTVHPGKLDMIAGGGIQVGEKARDAMVREASEEAGIPKTYSQKNLKACGIVSYHLSWSFKNNPGSFPHVLYMFEMELPWYMRPRKGSDEVDGFVSMTKAEVLDALFKDDFKPILGIQWADHFCRDGTLTSDNEPRLVEITSRMHRNLELALPDEA